MSVAEEMCEKSIMPGVGAPGFGTRDMATRQPSALSRVSKLRLMMGSASEPGESRTAYTTYVDMADSVTGSLR
jgi:hypothetical protein